MNDAPIFNDGIIHDDSIVFFYFECKRCRERWCSTICQCPRCKRVRKFRILDSQEFEDQMIKNMIADRIHYVMLVGEGEK